MRTLIHDLRSWLRVAIFSLMKSETVNRLVGHQWARRNQSSHWFFTKKWLSHPVRLYL